MSVRKKKKAVTCSFTQDDTKYIPTRQGRRTTGRQGGSKKASMNTNLDGEREKEKDRGRRKEMARYQRIARGQMDDVMCVHILYSYNVNNCKMNNNVLQLVVKGHRPRTFQSPAALLPQNRKSENK